MMHQHGILFSFDNKGEQMMQLTGLTLLITGGSRGLGLEMAHACARAGAAGITLTAAPGSDETTEAMIAELTAAKQLVEEAGTPCLTLLSDVRISTQCQDAVDRHLERFGGLDALINNAGKAGRYAHGGQGDLPLHLQDPDGLIDIIQTNIAGPYLMVHAALEALLKSPQGRIINISKRTDSMHQKAWTPYGPSKAALDAATIAWAESLNETSVTVNSLSPGGAVNTKFGTGSLTGKGIDPATIGPISVWLVSKASAAYTGCRFVGDRWQHQIDPQAAAEGCRESAIFHRPNRSSALDKAWLPPVNPPTVSQ
jgi:NAD(P)-dependent dehydrogenase (short-subunit alcohol dehydrogenase family)